MTFRRFLPLPPPYTGPDRCRPCVGRGVVGAPVRLKGRPTHHGEPTIILAEVICPRCGGCGRNPHHHGCTPPQHADWRQPPPSGCLHCADRGWWPMTAFDNSGRVLRLRMPCDCAGELTEESDG